MKVLKLKKTILILILVGFCFGLYEYVHAGSYVPLTPIPGLSDVQTGDTKGLSGTGFSTYLRMLYTWGVAAASGLAVVMIMWGGVEYMTSAGGGGVEEAKKRISAAIMGLLLALGSYIILYTINRNLLNLQFGIGELDVKVNKNAGVKFVQTTFEDSGGDIYGYGSGEFTGPYQDYSGEGSPSSVFLTAVRNNGDVVYDGRVYNANLIALDTDGTGNPGIDNERTADGRPQHQNQTSYSVNGQYLNSITDDYVAVPTSAGIRPGTPVLITDHTTGRTVRAISGDNGASGWGEMSISAATKLGIWGPGTGHTGNSIDQSHSITYTLGTPRD